jgi:hypothetical protein
MFYKKHSLTQQVFQVTSFDLVNKPSSKLCFYQEPSSDNLFFHVGLKSHSFTIYVMKI